MSSCYLAVLRSELKPKIILSLLEGAKKIADLKAEMRDGETTILHSLQELKVLKLVEKSDAFYKLSPIGFIIAQMIKESSSTIEVVEKFGEFWLQHDLKEIPPYLLCKLGSLKDSTMIKCETSALNKVHQTFLEILLESKWIKGISPIFHPDYLVVFNQLLSQGALAELIVTKAILSKILASADRGLMRKYLEEGRIKLFQTNDVKIALTVTQNSFSLGLFTLTGEYDYNMDLISHSNEAIEWGNFLFQEILKGARRFGPSL